MEITAIVVYLAGLFGIFAGAIKIDENLKLKKEIKNLRKKLGKE